VSNTLVSSDATEDRRLAGITSLSIRPVLNLAFEFDESVGISDM
jgi:hypothetical protein